MREALDKLFAGRDGALAAFASDGSLIHANAAAQERLAGTKAVSAFGLETLMATALETGSARGIGNLGGAPVEVSAERVDVDRERVLLVTLTRPGEPCVQISPPAAPSAPSIAVTPSAPAADTTETVAAAMPIAELAPVAEPAAPAPAAETPAPEPAAEAQISAPVVEPAAPAAEAPPVVASAPTTAEPAPAPIVAVSEPASTPAAAAQKAPPTPASIEPAAERRHPLRFVWHLDSDGRFGVASDEFLELAGLRTVAMLGKPWDEVAAALALDPKDEVTRAITSRETWSGLVVSWPVGGSDERLPVEMSGLPIFDRDRSFRGYRGFGVCRDIDRINQLARARREQPPAPEQVTSPAPAAEAAPAPVESPVAPPLAANVVPFRAAAVEPKTAETRTAPSEVQSPPALSPVERRAFRELAQELTARLREPDDELPPGAGIEPASSAAEAEAAPEKSAAETATEQALLDRIPTGVLVYRHDRLLFANRHFLEWSGYESLSAVEAAGGLSRLFAEPAADTLAATGGSEPQAIAPLSIVTQRGDTLPVEGRMFTVPWNGAPALALIATNGQNAAARRDAEHALTAAQTENRELNTILDGLTDGIVTLDVGGRIRGRNARAAALFGNTTDGLTGEPFERLLTPDSQRAARDYFDRTLGGAATLDNVLEVTAPGGGRPLALIMTLVRTGDRILAAFRDLTIRKDGEEALRNARRETARAASAKAEFLSKVSHELRTPLNAINGFAEVIMAERFGPVGNDRYREYIKDIHGAGSQIAATLNDLLDLSRAETGQIELNFANVNINEVTQQCVALMQPQANRARIIIRTSLTPGVPPVVADARSLRQIVISLISNSIKFTGPGGQVIVSTVFSDSREAIVRVRDTGTGMSDADLAAALEPFQQIATAGTAGSGGTGFGLALTKALAEANRAHFSIKTAPNAGTLAEIAFPPSRIVAG